MSPYIFFYDTETTGFPSEKGGARIVQVGAALVDSRNRKVVSTIDLILNPKVDVPDHLIKVHGITTEMCKECGVNSSAAIRTLFAMWNKSSVRIGHNEKFDARMVDIELGLINAPPATERWRNGKAICTMMMAHELTKDIPSMGKAPPSLTGALKTLMNKKVSKAHSALPDALDCMALYFYCLDNGCEPAWSKLPDPLKLPKARSPKDNTPNKDDIAIEFGKHSGFTPNQLAKKHPGYVVWLYETANVRGIVSRDLYLEVCDAIDQKPGPETGLRA